MKKKKKAGTMRKDLSLADLPLFSANLKEMQVLGERGKPREKIHLQQWRESI